MQGTRITKADLSKLRKQLPKHYRKDAVARMLKDKKRTVHPPYINAVLSEARFDQDVLDVLIAMRDEHQAGLDKLKARLKTKKVKKA